MFFVIILVQNLIDSTHLIIYAVYSISIFLLLYSPDVILMKKIKQQQQKPTTHIMYLKWKINFIFSVFNQYSIKKSSNY